MKRDNLILIYLLTACASALAAGNTIKHDKPNIIVIFTDDQGYADLGVQGMVDDIKTPNIDALCNAGVRCTSGYITAPQCGPSRAGMLTGRYQQRFGIDAISDTPLPLSETTIADRLKKAGYRTGMIGKWHLDPSFSSQAWLKRHPDAVVKAPEKPIGRKIAEKYRLQYSPGGRGFDEFYMHVGWWISDGHWANFMPDGSSLDPKGEWVHETTGDRLDDETAGALGFIKRNQDQPFFLYIGYTGPHTPLRATQERIDRFPGDMPERRRLALAMMATIDDGVGEIMNLLKKYEIQENTLIFFTSDNGAPLKRTMVDSPTEPLKDVPFKHEDMGGWDGSMNTPLNGEKGMLSEGGVRVPFFVTWKNKLPAGKVYDRPVMGFDIGATSLAAAGLEIPDNLDGVDLVPYLNGEKKDDPHKVLYWRFWTQSAVRSGDWKLLKLGDTREFLFNMKTDKEEKDNLIKQYPEKAAELEKQLETWASELKPAHLPRGKVKGVETDWYNFYMRK